MNKSSTPELHLAIGDSLQLQVPMDSKDIRYYVKVIGYVPGASLLVTTPTSGGKVQLIREGQEFIVRMLLGTQALGFTSTVLRTCARPYAYLHLSYPKALETTSVRNSVRINTNIIATVQNTAEGKGFKEPRPAMIVDISTTGAQFQCDEEIGDTGDPIVIEAKLFVAGITPYVTIPATLRRVSRLDPDENGTGAAILYGTEFQDLEENDRLAIHSLVYEQIASKDTK